MEAIYPVSALQKNQGEVKNAARQGVVRITENGRGAYIFCSEEVFEQRLHAAAEEAAYEARVAMAIEKGRADVAAGSTYSFIDAIDEIERRAEARG